MQFINQWREVDETHRANMNLGKQCECCCQKKSLKSDIRIKWAIQMVSRVLLVYVNIHQLSSMLIDVKIIDWLQLFREIKLNLWKSNNSEIDLLLSSEMNWFDWFGLVNSTFWSGHESVVWERHYIVSNLWNAFYTETWITWNLVYLMKWQWKWTNCGKLIMSLCYAAVWLLTENYFDCMFVISIRLFRCWLCSITYKRSMSEVMVWMIANVIWWTMKIFVNPYNVSDSILMISEASIRMPIKRFLDQATSISIVTT